MHIIKCVSNGYLQKHIKGISNAYFQKHILIHIKHKFYIFRGNVFLPRSSTTFSQKFCNLQCLLLQINQ